MKFLLDAHLPPSLATVLRRAGHDALHTRDLPSQNRTSDLYISDLSVREKRVLITKDRDFFYSHVLDGRPWKLLLVRTGNIGASELRALFERNLSAILSVLDTHTLVELDRGAVTVVR